MASVSPFRALRPAPEAAARVASVPYDVVNTEEARRIAGGNPLSFLHVTRAEIDLPADVNPYDDRVYDQAVQNLEALKREAPLVIEDAPSLYFYRLKMGAHEQTGLAACFSVDEYERGLIKKHEKTRKDKEDDRTRHVLETRAQTGVVFLTYRASSAIDNLARQACAGAPLYQLTASDGVAHTIWRVPAALTEPIDRAFAALPATYIADGHHRAASAARAHQSIAADGGRTAEASTFIAVAFPDSQMQILPYNRVVADLAGKTPEALLAELRSKVDVGPGSATPSGPGANRRGVHVSRRSTTTVGARTSAAHASPRSTPPLIRTSAASGHGSSAVPFEVDVQISVLALDVGTGEVVVTTRWSEVHATNSIGTMAIRMSD